MATTDTASKEKAMLTTGIDHENRESVNEEEDSICSSCGEPSDDIDDSGVCYECYEVYNTNSYRNSASRDGD